MSMLRENDLFMAAKYQDTEAHLFSTRREQPYLNIEAVDFEMQFNKRTDCLKITRLSQEGLEHFVLNYGHSYRVLYLDDCTRIQDFSPLGDLPELEALRLEWCRKADRLWDMSGNTSLKVLSIHDAKKNVSNPMQLQTSQTLEEIRLWGADFDNKHTLESLSCFQGMKSLKRIDLNMMKLQNRSLDILATLPKLEEFHFDAGMLTTEEIAWICAKHPNLYGDCLGVYTTNEVTCLNDIRICGHRKPGLDLPKDQKRLDKYTSEFNALVKKYRDEA